SGAPMRSARCGSEISHFDHARSNEGSLQLHRSLCDTKPELTQSKKFMHTGTMLRHKRPDRPNQELPSIGQGRWKEKRQTPESTQGSPMGPIDETPIYDQPRSPAQ